jgi:small subunit ribosomal protein S16
MGRRHLPFYRIVVADSRKPRDGRFVEILGHYDPKQDPEVLEVDKEKLDDWVKKGAQPTDTIKSLVKRLEKRQQA